MSCVFGKKSKRENTKQKLVGVCRGEKCVFGMKGKKSGRGKKKASGKTHGVGVGKEKQARKPTPEDYC